MGKRNDQVKIYIVVGLALVLAIFVYFRFIHAKTSPDEDRTHSMAPLDQFNIPLIKTEKPQNAQSREPDVYSSLYGPIRDIFSPLYSPPRAATPPHEPEASRLTPSFKLKGTIVGGRRPIAIIDDRFVSTGDWIGEYQVVWIGKKEALKK